MKRLIVVCTLVGIVMMAVDALAAAPQSARNPEAGFVSLFNGKDLTGWDGDPRLWSVKDSVIRGQTTKENPARGNTFCIWRDGSGENLIYNLGQLNIQPESIAAIVISHNHWDHTGGLKEFLKINSDAKVFRPKSFSKPTEISPSVHSTGALGRLIKEQSLVVNTEKGNLVITGCAHRGLANIIDKATQLGRIYGVLRGFHGFSELEKLRGIKIIAPCHCTQHIQQIRQRYPAEFKEIRAGTILEV